MFLCVLGPTGFRGLSSHFPTLCCGHADQASLPADPPAFAAHSGHDAGYLRRGNLGGIRLWRVRAGRPPNHLESRLVYVPSYGEVRAEQKLERDVPAHFLRTADTRKAQVRCAKTLSGLAASRLSPHRELRNSRKAS